MILQVTSLAEAKATNALGADMIIVQGMEAGGHGTGERTLFSLLPVAVDAVAPTPVVAAGGIADGRGLAAAHILGAEGALLGTRLFATQEALAGTAMKERLISASGDDTIRTRVFDLVRRIDWHAQYSGRAISNDFSATWHNCEAELRSQIEEQSARYETARQHGDLDTVALFAGEGLDWINTCPPVQQVIEQIVKDAGSLLPDSLQ